MKHPVKIGLSFGLISGVITTLGLMIGLDASTHSRIAVIGGILTIAIADALSDALGIHVSEESERKHTNREVWEATISTFLSKFVFSASFIIYVLFLDMSIAIQASIVWGLFLISILSYIISEGENSFKVILEHVTITLAVIIISHYLGSYIGSIFNP
jgi:VIT1/CCC1 family predicted Fe2+/Mn2+ transporter